MSDSRDRPSKPVSASYVQSVERIQPNQANNYGDAHGGIVIKLMDELAAIAAMRIAGETCVTAHIDAVDFLNPIPVGAVATLEAFVHETGTTSLSVYVAVESQDPRGGEVTETTSASFVMVAVDTDGRPTPVPAVVTETDRDRELRARVDR